MNNCRYFKNYGNGNSLSVQLVECFLAKYILIAIPNNETEENVLGTPMSFPNNNIKECEVCEECAEDCEYFSNKTFTPELAQQLIDKGFEKDIDPDLERFLGIILKVFLDNPGKSFSDSEIREKMRKEKDIIVTYENLRNLEFLDYLQRTNVYRLIINPEAKFEIKEKFGVH